MGPHLFLQLGCFCLDLVCSNFVRSPPILGNWWEIKELAKPMCLSVNLHPSSIKLLCSNLSVLRRNFTHIWLVFKIFVLLMGLSIAVRSTVSLSFTLFCSSGSVKLVAKSKLAEELWKSLCLNRLSSLQMQHLEHTSQLVWKSLCGDCAADIIITIQATEKLLNFFHFFKLAIMCKCVLARNLLPSSDQVSWITSISYHCAFDSSPSSNKLWT